MTTEMQGLDEFDVLLNDVLRTVANPEMPERVRVNVRTRVWVRELSTKRMPARPAVVFSPAAFQERVNPKRSTASTLWAVAAHIAAIALIFWGMTAKLGLLAPTKTATLTELTPPPPIAPVKTQTMGGGGGQHDNAPVSKGALPKLADQQITPPKAPPMEQPKIHMPDPTMEVQKDLKMATNNMPNLGMPNSPVAGASMGNGYGSGMGGGNGAGLGTGTGGNYGGGVKKIGGGVSAPSLLFSVDPEFSEEARKAKFMGVVTINLWVDDKGNPTHVRVLHGVGMGLDQKAVDAVKQYKFKPAMEAGKPVTVEMNVEVNFQIF